MQRLEKRKQNMRNRMRNRYFADKRIMEIYHIKEDLTREATDEIEQALWELKDSMDIPTEEIEIAIESRHPKN